MKDPDQFDQELGRLSGLVDAFGELGAVLRSSMQHPNLDAVTAATKEQLHAAAAVSVTVLKNDGSYESLAATDKRAEQLDELQYELRSGPCLDAAAEGVPSIPVDLAQDERWPEFGSRAVAEHDVHTMLAYRLGADLPELTASLNVYGTTTPFSELDCLTGLLLATHATSVLTAKYYVHRAHHLEVALSTNREIGIAIGVLMNSRRLSRDQGFDLLRIASQHTNRRLRDVAAQVADTGDLPALPHREATGPGERVEQQR